MPLGVEVLVLSVGTLLLRIHLKVLHTRSDYNLAELGGGAYVILQDSSNKNTINFTSIELLSDVTVGRTINGSNISVALLDRVLGFDVRLMIDVMHISNITDNGQLLYCYIIIDSSV